MGRDRGGAARQRKYAELSNSDCSAAVSIPSGSYLTKSPDEKTSKDIFTLLAWYTWSYEILFQNIREYDCIDGWMDVVSQMLWRREMEVLGQNSSGVESNRIWVKSSNKINVFQDYTWNLSIVVNIFLWTTFFSKSDPLKRHTNRTLPRTALVLNKYLTKFVIFLSLYFRFKFLT